MTVLTAESSQPHLPADGLVEVRGPDGRLLGCYKLAAPTAFELELGFSLKEFNRPLDDPNTVWYTAEEFAVRIRELRCSR